MNCPCRGELTCAKSAATASLQNILRKAPLFARPMYFSANPGGVE